MSNCIIIMIFSERLFKMVCYQSGVKLVVDSGPFLLNSNLNKHVCNYRNLLVGMSYLQPFYSRLCQKMYLLLIQ